MKSIRTRENLRVIHLMAILVPVIMIPASVSPVFAQWPNEEVYTGAVKNTVWIKTDQGYGSGVFLGGKVILSEKIGIVATNKHVIDGSNRVEVIFPFLSRKSNKWKSDRSWYDKNKEFLSEIGYHTDGQVVLESDDYDLAIVEIYNFPERMPEIHIPTLECEEFSKGEPMHILGNPKGRELWRWTAGHFVGCDSPNQEFFNMISKTMYIAATVSPGNSGGPVFDQRGRLVGIVKARDGETRVHAIPIEVLIQGLSFAGYVEYLVIDNRTNLDVTYIFESKEDDERLKEKIYTYNGKIESGNSVVFAFFYAEDINIRLSDDSIYSLDAFPNLAFSISVLEMSENNREIRAMKYILEKNGSRLKMYSSRVHRYSIDMFENQLELRSLKRGETITSKDLAK